MKRLLVLAFGLLLVGAYIAQGIAGVGEVFVVVGAFIGGGIALKIVLEFLKGWAE